MTNCWRSDQDFNEDLKELSDFHMEEEELPAIVKPTKAKPHPQRNDLTNKHYSYGMGRSKYKQGSKHPRSIYDNDESDEEEEEVCRPIRGYPIGKENYGLRNPGGYPSFLVDYNETHRQIRQVSGFGYSNEFIEHTLGARSMENGRTKSTAQVGVKEPSNIQSAPVISLQSNRVQQSPPPLYDMIVKKQTAFNLDSKKEFPDLK